MMAFSPASSSQASITAHHGLAGLFLAASSYELALKKCTTIYYLFSWYLYRRNPRDVILVDENQQLQPATVMPNIKPRPNLHAQHHNLDTLERLVFEDFNGSLYASKSTIVMSGCDGCDWSLLRRKLEFIDPRGYINIAWLFVQVRAAAATTIMS
jgi:hypothetical protein